MPQYSPDCRITIHQHFLLTQKPRHKIPPEIQQTILRDRFVGTRCLLCWRVVGGFCGAPSPMRWRWPSLDLVELQLQLLKYRACRRV